MSFNCIAIEDERIIQMLIKRIISRKMGDKLNLLGIAGSGGEARDLLDQHRDELDLIFLDVVLPDTTGFDLLEELDIPDHVQVILMTGDDKIQERASQYNFADIIIKPFDLERIQEALQKVEET